jgi:hypothetical protein
LKAASQGSNAPVLRQFACPNAAVGTAASNTADSAQALCLACILIVRIDPARFACFAPRPLR